MAVFKIVVSAKDGKAYQIEKEQSACASLMGKTIGNEFSGDLIGLNGYTLIITGGSDKDGFPMRNDIEGTLRKKFLIKKSIGFKGTKKRGKKTVKHDGLKRKRTLRGNTISDDIVQINCVVKEEGKESLEKLLGSKKKKEDKSEEKEESAESEKKEAEEKKDADKQEGQDKSASKK